MNEDSALFMVDGRLRDAGEVRELFRPHDTSIERLPIRQQEAAKMVGSVCARGRLLDVGCYAGVFLEALKTRYPELDIVGVDSYPDNVRMARLLYPHRAEQYSQQSVYRLGFDDSVFDCVTLLEVIEHIDRPVDALRELNRVLRLGGHLILSTPNGTSLRHMLHTIASGYKNTVRSWLGRHSRLGTSVYFANVEWNRHLIEFSPGSLHMLIAINGFDLVAHRFIPTGEHYGIVDLLAPGLAAGQILLCRKREASPTEII